MNNLTLQNLPGWLAATPLGFGSAIPIYMELLASALLVYLAVRFIRLITKAIATLRATALTPALSRLLSKWIKRQDFTDEDFFNADGASELRVELRKRAIARLAAKLGEQCAKSIAWGEQIRASFSDLRFTDANRVPFRFAGLIREKFNLCSVVTSSSGSRLRDLDGHWTLDVSGSYGLNVAGFDQYKQWIERGWDRVKELGPVLGPLHPVVAENVEFLKSISKMDEVSFHMSGTEAVMAAVRTARFNTRRKLIVCFAGAYHGWWDGVQPGLGSERTIPDCLTLKDLNRASLGIIRRRAREIAAVLVNPIQSFHPNSPPPSDAILLTSNFRKAQDSSPEYTQWLRELREVCTECDVALMFDEVFTGFRLAPGGAQEYFDVAADIVVYGKTVAGGMPIGVVCGKRELMQRFDPERPMRIAYVIGTFSAHPAVMGAMNEFLRWVTQSSTAEDYKRANRRCTEWAGLTNQQMAEMSLPVRVIQFATVWTVLFKQPGRYNWLLQYYLRAEGVTLSWVGTGRCLSSLDYSETDYEELQAKLVSAADKMNADGWWLSEQEQPGRVKTMRNNLIREVVGSVVQVPRPARLFYAEIMQRKHDDHVASHSNRVNQLFHLASSSVFLCCYVLAFRHLTLAMSLGLAALLIRQFGHAILEPPSHDKEKLLLGFTTRSKSLLVAGYLLIPLIQWLRVGFNDAASTVDAVAAQWFALTLMVVFGHVLLLIWEYDFRSSMIWLVKLITDPITDIKAYYTSPQKILQSLRIRKEQTA